MIGLGLASAHAPAMFSPPELWPKIYAAIPDYMKDSQPHTARLETPEVVRSHKQRTDAAFEFLRAQIEAYKPDALVVVGNDQGEMFDLSNNPSLSIFVGSEIWGSSKSFYEDLPPEDSRIRAPVHTELAKFLYKGLSRRGFDPASSDRVNPAGRKPERGISHMLVFPLPRLVPALDIPVVPIFLNTHFPPMPGGQRCWDLGVALGQLLSARPERIAIYASGGMSHDPAGPRAGWIDEPLDHWILERIEQDRGHEMANLFSFDSDTMRGGTGELRAWITVAAACQWPGKKVEYISSHHAKAGLGFCYWPAESAHLNRVIPK
jgi:hypothetical protein